MIAWQTEFERASIEELVRLTQKYELIKKPVKVDELIQEP